MRHGFTHHTKYTHAQSVQILLYLPRFAETTKVETSRRHAQGLSAKWQLACCADDGEGIRTWSQRCTTLNGAACSQFLTPTS